MGPVFDFFAGFGAWNWLILASVLLVLEILAPGIYLIWFGGAALLTGLVAFAIPLEWQYQLLLFAMLSLIALIAARYWVKTNPLETDRPNLNRRADQYVGGSYILSEAIVDGRGKAKVGDTQWLVAGPDAPRGSVVRVVGADGNILRVVAAEN